MCWHLQTQSISPWPWAQAPDEHFAGTQPDHAHGTRWHTLGDPICSSPASRNAWKNGAEFLSQVKEHQRLSGHSSKDRVITGTWVIPSLSQSCSSQPGMTLAGPGPVSSGHPPVLLIQPTRDESGSISRKIFTMEEP